METNNLEFDLNKEIEDEILYSAIESEIKIEEDRKETLNTSRKRKRKGKNRNSKLKITLKRDVEIKTILLILLFLVANTYAWFKYASIADAQIRMHIKDWNFELTTDGSDEDLVIVADEIYPGMTEVRDSLKAKNSGEMKAIVYLQYQSIEVLGTTYAIGDSIRDEASGEDVLITFDYLKNFILAKYPFKIDMYADGVLINPDDKLIIDSGSEKEISVAVNWLYENGITNEAVVQNDLIDTKIGKEAYEFHKAHPDEDSVKIILKVIAEQYDGSELDAGVTP